MGHYDKIMKSLVDNDPEALTRFILHEWQKQRRTVLPNVKITAVKQLDSAFHSPAKQAKRTVTKAKRKAKQSKGESESEELAGDSVLLVEGPDGPLYLIELEFQSNLHPYMPVRSLEYLARAMKKHWKACAHLPVIAAVIYLFDEKGMPHSPLVWPEPAEHPAMVFHYLSIQMKEIPREQFLALREPTLWPLALLTAGPVDCILIEQMFSELMEKQLYGTLPLGYALASWLLEGDDLDWLEEVYQHMQGFFGDPPALDWMRKSLTKSLTQKLQREAEQKILEAQKRNEQRLLEAEKRNEQKMLEERKKMLEEQRQAEKKTLTMYRETVVALVSQRFPSLQRIAKAQVSGVKQLEILQKTVLRLSLASDAGEAEELLFSLTEKAEDEDEEDG